MRKNIEYIICLLLLIFISSCGKQNDNQKNNIGKRVNFKNNKIKTNNFNIENQSISLNNHNHNKVINNTNDFVAINEKVRNKHNRYNDSLKLSEMSSEEVKKYVDNNIITMSKDKLEDLAALLKYNGYYSLAIEVYRKIKELSNSNIDITFAYHMIGQTAIEGIFSGRLKVGTPEYKEAEKAQMDILNEVPEIAVKDNAPEIMLTIDLAFDRLALLYTSVENNGNKAMELLENCDEIIRKTGINNVDEYVKQIRGNIYYNIAAVMGDTVKPHPSFYISDENLLILKDYAESPEADRKKPLAIKINSEAAKRDPTIRKIIIKAIKVYKNRQKKM